LLLGLKQCARDESSMNQRPTLLKPVGPESLAGEGDFWLGNMFVRPSLREIRIGELPEILEPRVMQVLVVLAGANGAVVSRDDLIMQCWGGRIVGEAAINRCIFRLRQLADLSGGKDFRIETIARVGYRLVRTPADNRFELPSKPDTTRPPQAGVPTGTTDLGSMSREARSRFPKIALLAVVVVGVVAAAVTLIVMLRAPNAHPGPQPTNQSAASVAVLPFTPLYTDADAQSYTDEISSDIATTLGQTDLNVIAPAHSFQFRGDAKARAARALHADIFVDGDVKRTGDNLVVSVRVEDVASGIILLSKDIQRPASQAADLPDQVATFVAGALGGGDSIRALKPDGRWSPRVRTGFLRALFQCPYRQDPLCAYEVGRNLVSVAPENAMAQTILAIETTNALDQLPEKEKPAAIAAARKAAWTAIRLDPHFGDPYIALGVLAADTAASEGFFRRGLSVSPDSSGLAGYLSGLLISTGRSHEALAVIQKVAARFTFAQFIPLTQIWAMLQLGEADDALEIAQHGRKLWPERGLFRLLAFDATAFNGDFAGAEALLKDPLAGPIQSIFWDIMRALRSRSAPDIAAVTRDCANLDASHWPRVQVCLLALTVLGRIDETFRLPVDDSSQNMLFFPQTAPLRADPRFQGLTEKLHLFSYWKATHTRPDFCATEHVPVCQALVRSAE
jgi:DNA-binding winged helix-turn-helix (wHTH) protein/TolB-like protein